MKKNIPLGFSINSDSKFILSELMKLDLSQLFNRLENKTPLIKSWEDDNLWLKLENLNKSGSFKNRAINLIANFIKINQIKKTAIITSGNAGVALVNDLKNTDVEIKVFTEDDKKFNSLRSGIIKYNTNKSFVAKIIEVICSKFHHWDLSWSLANSNFLNNLIKKDYYLSQPSIFTNVLGLIGYSSISFEIFRQLKSVPDVIITPVINSDNALGQWLGYFWMNKKALISKIPIIVLVESKKNISHFNYPDAWYLIKKISDVQIISIDQDLIKKYVQLLKQHNLEIAEISASTLAAYHFMIDNKLIDKKAKVVSIISGKNDNHV